jgi:hypothetical protein
MKTSVEIIGNYQYQTFAIGEKGYIDGYLQCADNRPYAVVVIGEKLDFVPIQALKVIKN